MMSLIKIYKNIQTEILEKNILSKIKNTIDEMNNRLDTVEGKQSVNLKIKPR